MSNLINELITTISVALPAAGIIAGKEMVKESTKKIFNWASSKLASIGKEKVLKEFSENPSDERLINLLESSFETLLEDENNRNELTVLLQAHRTVVQLKFDQKSDTGKLLFEAEISESGVSDKLANVKQTTISGDISANVKL